jgi:hypothetical protein
MSGQKTTGIRNNTNLASEFYVLSVLHRLGANPVLTLGNKKAVDIVVEKEGKSLTIDVKGIKSKTGFPADNCTEKSGTHYYVFVSYLNKIEDVFVLPEVYIVPAKELYKKHKELGGETVIYTNPKKNRKIVSYSRLKALTDKYLNKWDLFN